MCLNTKKCQRFLHNVFSVPSLKMRISSFMKYQQMLNAFTIVIRGRHQRRVGEKGYTCCESWGSLWAQRKPERNKHFNDHCIQQLLQEQDSNSRTLSSSLFLTFRLTFLFCHPCQKKRNFSEPKGIIARHCSKFS